MKGWGGVGGVGGHANVPCASSATCCYADFVWVGNPQARWVWKNILPWNGENQPPHWNNRCRMECCQRLHPQLVVFEGQRSSPLCEVLAVEMCESAYPSPAKKQFQRWSACFGKTEKACQHAPMTWIQNPHETPIWPNSRVRIWHNSACRNVCFAMAKKRFVRKTLFLRARFPVCRDDYVIL